MGELHRRLAGLPRDRFQGREIGVAVGVRIRLLGLAFLNREHVGQGLLITGCRSVHTFGMRFDLDLYFLDARGEPTSIRRAVPPNRLVSDRRAVAVVELPSRGSRGESP